MGLMCNLGLISSTETLPPIIVSLGFWRLHCTSCSRVKGCVYISDCNISLLSRCWIFVSKLCLTLFFFLDESSAFFYLYWNDRAYRCLAACFFPSNSYKTDLPTSTYTNICFCFPAQPPDRQVILGIYYILRLFMALDDTCSVSLKEVQQRLK